MHINKAIYFKDHLWNLVSLNYLQVQTTRRQGFYLEKSFFYPVFSSNVSLLFQSVPTLNLNTFLTINNPSTICRTICHIWKANVIILFMSLEANPYISAVAPSCDWTKTLSSIYGAQR